MHILVGLLLLLIAFGAVFFIAQTGVLSPLSAPFTRPHATSTVSNNSEYYHQVRMQFVATGSGLDMIQAVSLLANPAKENEGIVVTGWVLKTNKGSYTIPKAANVYSPSVAGVPPEDIYLRKGGTVNLYSGKNPQGDQQAIRSGLGEWRIWLDGNFLAVPHGKIILVDQKGKIVDEYEY